MRLLQIVEMATDVLLQLLHGHQQGLQDPEHLRRRPKGHRRGTGAAGGILNAGCTTRPGGFFATAGGDLVAVGRRGPTSFQFQTADLVFEEGAPGAFDATSIAFSALVPWSGVF